MVKLKIGLYKHKETGQYDVMINQIDNIIKVHNGEFKKVEEFEYYEETKEKTYNIQLDGVEFFIILNSLYHYRQEKENPKAINKIIDKFDYLYFK